VSKETYYSVKRDLPVSKETYLENAEAGKMLPFAEHARNVPEEAIVAGDSLHELPAVDLGGELRERDRES
jgi:hypothetical protein